MLLESFLVLHDLLKASFPSALLVCLVPWTQFLLDREA